MISKYQIIITILFVFNGAIVSLSLKLIDQQKSKYRNGIEYSFSHPFFQAFCMFLAMSVCLVIFKSLYYFNKPAVDVIEQYQAASLNTFLDGNQNFNSFIFLPASLFDMIATALNFMGLSLTYASSYQMLNGSIMIFTGLLSVAFIGRQLSVLKWSGLMINVFGLAIIGLCDFIYKTDDQIIDINALITGDLLIIMSRVFAAMQLVYEEKYIKKYNVAPLQAVGYEGIYGCVMLGVLLIPMYYIRIPLFSKVDPENRIENTIEAVYQVLNNKTILIAFIVNLFSTAVLNFTALTVTKEMSSVTRVIFGNLRTILVWLVALCLKWEIFRILQLLGFLFLIIGTFVYNEINFYKVLLKIFRKRQSNTTDQDEADEHRRLLENSNQNES